MDIESVREAAGNFLAALTAAMAGRMARHVLLVQKGLRGFWGAHLLLELPVAIFMGFVGAGLADWLVLSPRAGTGLIAALSYLGPNAIERMLSKWINERNGG